MSKINVIVACMNTETMSPESGLRYGRLNVIWTHQEVVPAIHWMQPSVSQSYALTTELPDSAWFHRLYCQ